MAKKEAAGGLCPECKGPKRGRGFTHAARCSLKGKTSAGTGKRRGKKDAGNAMDASGFRKGMFRDYSVRDLVAARDEINAEISSLADLIKGK
jgi:hypothetical protein